MDDPTFQNILKQAYNYDIYKNEWESSKLLRDFIGLFERYCSENETTFMDMIYQEPEYRVMEIALFKRDTIDFIPH